MPHDLIRLFKNEKNRPLDTKKSTKSKRESNDKTQKNTFFIKIPLVKDKNKSSLKERERFSEKKHEMAGLWLKIRPS